MDDQTNAAEFTAENSSDEMKMQKWSVFVETTLADFFTGYKLEKLNVEDGSGNKAKLSRTKDNGIKVEQSSTTIL